MIVEPITVTQPAKISNARVYFLLLQSSELMLKREKASNSSKTEKLKTQEKVRKDDMQFRLIALTIKTRASEERLLYTSGFS